MLGHKLFSENRIAFQVEKLGNVIRKDLSESRIENVTLLVFLKGAAPFAVDLAKRLSNKYIDYEVEYVFNTDNLEEQLVSLNLTGKHVILIEDIVDTGKTIVRSRAVLDTKELASLRVVSFLVRDDESIKLVDYYGFKLTTPEFVIGYGLDYKGFYRELPDIYVYEKG